MAGLNKGVRGGTISGPPLCPTCRWSRTMRGEAPSQEVLYCHQIGKSLPWQVFECKDYDDKRQPSLNDLYDQAWVLLTDRKDGQWGFVDATKYKAIKAQRGGPPEKGVDY